MSQQPTNKPANVKILFSQADIQKRFEELLGAKAQGFISSVLQIVNSNKSLASADPSTVLNAAATAAALDLPINPNLGFAWIVPYKGQAQFQMGWKGFVQLAQRTGQYQRINVVPIFENQFRSYNPLSEDLEADFTEEGSGKVVGYVAYFRMNNGFEKLSFWSREKVVKHAKKYSQSYGRGYSPWDDVDQFDAMAMKTVLKNTLSKWGILSIEMQTAVIADQSVQVSDGSHKYPDNASGIDLGQIEADKERERILAHIANAKTKEELGQVQGLVEPGSDMEETYLDKLSKLKK